MVFVPLSQTPLSSPHALLFLLLSPFERESKRSKGVSKPRMLGICHVVLAVRNYEQQGPAQGVAWGDTEAEACWEAWVPRRALDDSKHPGTHRHEKLPFWFLSLYFTMWALFHPMVLNANNIGCIQLGKVGWSTNQPGLPGILPLLAPKVSHHGKHLSAW